MSHIERFASLGGSMNLNVHFHVVVPDGVFTAAKSAARADFWRLPTPDRMDLETLAMTKAALVGAASEREQDQSER